MNLTPYLRRTLSRLIPESGLARFALYLLLVDLVLFVAQQGWVALAPGPGAGDRWGGWIRFLNLVLAALFSILLVRWIRRRLLWRLRNRLLVTYVFIGVIPVGLLALMALISGYIFAGQFATYLVTQDLQTELRSLEAANQAIAAELANNLKRGLSTSGGALPALEENTREEPLRLTGRRDVTAWFRGRPRVLQATTPGRALARPEWMQEEARSAVRDQGKLWLRVATTVPVGTEKLLVISSVPLDEALLNRVSGNIGVATFYLKAEKPAAGGTPETSEQKLPDALFAVESKSGAQVVVAPAEEPGGLFPSVAGGTLAPPTQQLDREVTFGAVFPYVDWQTGESLTGIFTVRTRPSALYGRLFGTLGQFANAALIFLAGVGIFFAVIELLALLVGLGLTRTITRSVAALYEATERINRGELSHRIQVRSRDQLAELESSFNSMTGSLERLIVEQKEKERMQSELAIAQEVQEQLFPRVLTQLQSLEVHGFCRPARSVSGDYFDFLTAGEEQLGIAVGDISGKGISAALLMASVHSAVRAYQMEAVHLQTLPPGNVAAGHAGYGNVNGRPSPATLLRLLNRHLYLTTTDEKYATLFLGFYDGRERTLTYSNAGHLPPLILGADGSLDRLEAGGLVIGLFENATHEEESVRLRPGDIFVAFSDGIIEPENEFGEFGQERLVELVRGHRERPLEEISGAVTAAVYDWIGAAEQPDDITLVLARCR